MKGLAPQQTMNSPIRLVLLLFAGLLILSSVLFIQPTPTAHAAPPLQTCSPTQVRATERWWFFGNRAAVDFGVTGTTASAFQSPASYNSNEGWTVVTDTTGQLLFYSNGMEVYNASHQIMPNGSGLLGNFSATQTVAAFPAVGQPGVYFVVANSTDVHNIGPNGTLTYSVVDMSLNGGLGDVTATKNVQLGGTNTSSEALTAIPNDDGTGFWVVTYTNNSTDFLAYEFNDTGPVTGSPVTTTLPSTNLDGFGTLNLSPDLSQIVLLSGDTIMGSINGNTLPTKVALLDFDATTGQVSQQFEWQLPTGAGTGNRGYSADFSPDGSYLYATKIFGTGQLYRYDIANNSTGPDVQASMEQLGSIGTSGGQVRRGPDGRMYVANNGFATLSVVNDPDNATTPNFVTGGFSLAAGTASGFGLPQTATGCPLPVPGYEVAKSSNPSSGTTVAIGTKITYSATVTNTGDAPLTNLSFTDDLSDVVDDASYNNDASATIGTASFNAPDELEWQGDLGVGQFATITYSVTVTNPPGDGTLTNNVATTGTPISNCSAEAGTPANCTTTHKVAPPIVTDLPSSVTLTDATLNGNLDSLGGFSPVQVFFRYRIQGSGDPFTETAPQEMTAPGTFSQVISGLTANTTYEYFAVVTWEDGGTQELEGVLRTFVATLGGGSNDTNDGAGEESSGLANTGQDIVPMIAIAGLLIGLAVFFYARVRRAKIGI